jgi:hypothetical protein
VSAGEDGRHRPGCCRVSGYRSAIGLIDGVDLPSVEVDDVHDGGGSPNWDAVLHVVVSLCALRVCDQASETQQTAAESKQAWMWQKAWLKSQKMLGGREVVTRQTETPSLVNQG